MDTLKNYFIRPWDSTVMLSDAPAPRFVWEHLLRVYCALAYTFAFMVSGAYGHLLFNTGGWIMALGFIGSLWWLSRINPWREFRRAVPLMVAAYCFGAFIGPLINLVIETDQREIIKIITGGIIFFSCHIGAAVHSFNRRVTYRVGGFSASILITAWVVISETYPGFLTYVAFPLLLPFPWYLVVFLHRFFARRFNLVDVNVQMGWISLLCFCFDYPLHDLLNVYVIVLMFIHHIKIHSQETIFLAIRDSEPYYVNSTITFFTCFPARTISLYRHFVVITFTRIRAIIRLRLRRLHLW